MKKKAIRRKTKTEKKQQQQKQKKELKIHLFILQCIKLIQLMLMWNFWSKNL